MEQQAYGDLSLDAAEDLSSYQFYMVGLNSSGNALLADGDETIAIGILQNKPASGRSAEIRHGSGKISKCIYATTTAVGDKLKPSSGKGTPTTTNGDRYLCIALESGSANTIGRVLMEPGYI